MTNHEPQWALFVSKAPPYPDAETKRQQLGRKKLQDAFDILWQQQEANHILGQHVVLLPLPHKLPLLSQFVAFSQEFDLQYTVQLFGPALLSYSSEPPSEKTP
jgi:hypothetical protein